MLDKRSEELEIMDDLSISGSIISQTLQELNTINKVLGGNKISLTAYRKMCDGKRNLVIADLGCGGGDIMVEMAKYSKLKKYSSSFIGIDANPHIIEYAKENTKSYPEIAYQSINIFGDDFRAQQFDIIHCCLFLHHFNTNELVRLFRQFKEQARVGVIVNDLHRHPIAFRSIKMLTSLFSKSAMVRNDAAVSVARGFKKSELIEILEKAGIESFELSWKWAFRWKLVF